MKPSITLTYGYLVQFLIFYAGAITCGSYSAVIKQVSTFINLDQKIKQSVEENTFKYETKQNSANHLAPTNFVQYQTSKFSDGALYIAQVLL